MNGGFFSRISINRLPHGWGQRRAHDDDLIAVAGNLQIAGAVEKNHRARVFVNRSLMRDILYIDIEHRTAGQVDGLDVHQIAFEEEFDPGAVLRHAENDASGVFDRSDELLAASLAG